MSAEEKATIDKGMHISPDALKEGKFVLGSFDEVSAGFAVIQLCLVFNH